jgi:hypothetical protein
MFHGIDVENFIVVLLDVLNMHVLNKRKVNAYFEFQF